MAEECSTYLFTSESVTEGHPDKVCDQISDAVLDAILAKEIELAAAGYVAPSGQPADPAQVRVACETMATTGMVIVTGEIRTQAYVDVPAIVRERVGERNSVRINSILTDIIAHSGDGALKMSPEMQEAVDVFTDFMYQGVYYNPIAKGEERKVQNILGSIWEYYVNHIDELPAVYQSIADDEGPQRAVCDYVSGMTDSYALEVYSELFIPAAWTIK